MMEWISVEDRLPEDMEEAVWTCKDWVIAFGAEWDDDPFPAVYYEGEWYDLTRMESHEVNRWKLVYYPITHWMPKPDPSEVNMGNAQLRGEIEKLKTKLKDCRAIEVMLDGMYYAQTDED